MKTEKEKAAEGLLYNANHDSELQDEMKRAKCVLFKYNQLPPDQEEEKDRILTSFLGKKGDRITVFFPFLPRKGRTPLSYPLSNAIMAIISRLGIISSPT